MQPLGTILIFTFVFGQLARLPSDGLPYAVFAFAGLLPWQLFAGAVQRAAGSLVGNANLWTKVHFSLLVIPCSAVLSGLVDFAISLAILLGLMLYYGIAPSWAALFVPVFVVFALITALAMGIWLAALNVRLRDVGQALPFLIQAWMYASPVVYSTQLIPEGRWQFIYSLNPMAAVIQGFRWALLGSEPPGPLMLFSAALVILILISGLLFFRKTEATFADVV